MSYVWTRLLTIAFWRHVFLSQKTYRSALEVIGITFVAAQIAEFFEIYPDLIKQDFVLHGMFATAALAGIWSRFPVTRIRHKIPGKDYHIEVRIGDILNAPNGIVISTNSTFDTNISSKLIAADSLQGQFTLRYFNGEVADLDRQISKALRSTQHESASSPGKRRRYPLGTVAQVTAEGKVFYLVAMANLNETGNARTNDQDLDIILDGLWKALRDQGELGDLHVPLIGSGRGRLQIPRQKIIERIAQSFVYASKDGKIANRIIITISDADARNYDLNLFQVRDFLTLSLHT
ncbi:MAG: macro domain-containing protein [Pseudomonadota bacterium]